MFNGFEELMEELLAFLLQNSSYAIPFYLLIFSFKKFYIQRSHWNHINTILTYSYKKMSKNFFVCFLCDSTPLMYVMWIKICLLASLYCRLLLHHKWIFILNTKKMAYEISIKFIIHIALDEFSWLFTYSMVIREFLDFNFSIMKISNFNGWWREKNCIFSILLRN